MKKNIVLLLVIFLTIFTACSEKKGSEKLDYSNSTDYVQTPPDNEKYRKNDVADNNQQDVDDVSPPINDDAISDDELKKIGKKIIKNGNIEIKVDDYSKEIIKIKDTLDKFDCYISSELETNYDSYTSNQLTIRVKSDEFDDLINTILSGDGQVISKSISVNDVTEQYIDVYQRLKTKEKVLAQYEVYLKKAYTINDILNVTNYMRQIQEEIDVAKGRLKYLNDQSDYSTIILNISQNPEEIVKNNFFNKLIDGVEAGWNGLLNIIIGFFYLWPLWILIVIVIFVIRSIKKKRNKNKING
ncbi:MAG: DUF4349 domain-containing protein [Bacteroidota bacterium]|nr:DUF4349 domain-containing protein [Bacteroidota bacterium]